MKFNPDETKEEDFTLANGKTTRVPLMRMKKYFKFGYSRQLNVQALELPYEGDKLSLVVLLPGQANGINALEKVLTADHLMNPERHFRMYNQKVEVFLPRFKVEDSFQLKRTLAGMGMRDAFTPFVADFSGMNGRRDLFISDVVHKVFMEVNEEGSEVAGATGVIVEMTSLRLVQPIFRADHPFLFFIRERETGAILFLGKYTTPVV